MNIRLLPIVGAAGFLSVALAGTALAGGGWPAPGVYKLADAAAFASLSGPPTTVCDPYKGCGPGPSDSAYVTVDRGLHTFKAKGGGAPVIQQSGTMLTLGLYTASNGNYVFGCWMIPDSDFVVASDLSSASVSTTVPPQSTCPGQPMGLTPAGALDGKPGGGGGGGSPITINVTWTWNGVVGHEHDAGQYACGSFKATAGFDYDVASATSQGQFTGASATLTDDFSAITQSANNQVISGTLPDACQ